MSVFCQTLFLYRCVRHSEWSIEKLCNSCRCGKLKAQCFQSTVADGTVINFGDEGQQGYLCCLRCQDHVVMLRNAIQTLDVAASNYENEIVQQLHVRNSIYGREAHIKEVRLEQGDSTTPKGFCRSMLVGNHLKAEQSEECCEGCMRPQLGSAESTGQLERDGRIYTQRHCNITNELVNEHKLLPVQSYSFHRRMLWTYVLADERKQRHNSSFDFVHLCAPLAIVLLGPRLRTGVKTSKNALKYHNID
mmetsp:Transcript_25470/g.66651  ORF Transcript_25470/g.66651 Transcript_25470/m.66651 type:complete len:248 (+) Transcript_25470:4365-5108(+)